MTLLNVHDLQKTFGKKQVVKGISFDIQEGNCLALLGPNGAGKTTILSMISGLLSKDSGTVSVNGKMTGILRDIGYLPQFPSFYSWMTAKEYLILVAQLSNINKQEAAIKADDILDLVKLSDVKGQRIGGFSGGMKQRLGLAQAFIHQPSLLILDEPVSALDPLGRREVLDMMHALKKHTTILFSTHVLHDAEEICDDIIILREGSIAISGSLNAVKERYQQPLLKLKSSGNLVDLVHALKPLDVINNMQIKGNMLEIHVTDITKVKTELLTYLLVNDFPFESLEVASSTLEDLFLEVVSA